MNDPGEGTGSMFAAKPFSPCKMLCRHFRIGKMTRLWILHDKPGLIKFHLRWVLHALLSNQKSEIVTYSKHPLTAVMEQKVSRFQRISPGMSYGSSSIAPVIRSERPRVMGFLNVSSIKLPRKSA
jgi:hypothetical protein